MEKNNKTPLTPEQIQKNKEKLQEMLKKDPKEVRMKILLAATKKILDESGR